MSQGLFCIVGRPSRRAALNVSKEINKFRRIYGDNVRVITFEDELSQYFTESIGVERWVDSISYSNYMSLWKESYTLLDQISEKAGSVSKKLLYEFHHHSADTLLRCLVINHLLTQSSEKPVMLIVPDGPSKAYNKFGLKHKRKGSWLIDVLINRIQIKRVFNKSFFKLNHKELNQKQQNKVDRLAIVVVEDGISAVNHKPAIEILEQMRTEGLLTYAATSNPIINKELNDRGFITLYCGNPSLRIFSLQLVRTLYIVNKEIQLLLKIYTNNNAVSLFLSLFLLRSIRSVVFRESANKFLEDRVEKNINGVFLAVNEASPLAVIGMEWAKTRGFEQFGFWPVLVGERPDYDFFPAEKHFVYGEQLRDKMLNLGIKADSVFSVGSTTYDVAFGSDILESKFLTSTRILKKWDGDKKLIIVATEAFPHPLIELEPVLNALVNMDGVYVVLKIHPADNVTYFEEFLINNDWLDKVDLVEQCDLVSLLHAADLLVSINSNIIVTAAVLGTMTLVCDFSNKSRSLNFVSEGLCLGCFEPEKVEEKLNKMLFDTLTKIQAKKMIHEKISRFNGPNDGKSTKKIVEILLETLNT